MLFVRGRANESAPVTFTDEALGVVVWNAADSCWYFDVTLGTDRFVPAAFSPTDGTPPGHAPAATGPEWDVVRACLRQVRAREADARALVLAHNEHADRRIFRPRLAFIMFTTTHATFVYDELLAGAFCVTIDPDGAFVSGPAWIPRHEGDDPV
jgi:hypothetical protein